MTLTPWSAGCEQAGDFSGVSRKCNGMEQGQGMQVTGLEFLQRVGHKSERDLKTTGLTLSLWGLQNP